MPHLVKGGKYIFGWTTLNKEGRIYQEALEHNNINYD